MADIVDIALSAEASGVADSILEKGLFKNKSDVMTFAAAYMIKYYFDEFDPSTYNFNLIIMGQIIVIVHLILMGNGQH